MGLIQKINYFREFGSFLFFFCVNKIEMKGLFVFVVVVAFASAEDSCHRACPEMWSPVCSTDGRTLPSRCEFEVYQCEKAKIDLEIAVAYQGECKEAETGCPMVCPTIFAPVCGSDGQTYDNECKLEYASCRAFKEDGVEIHLEHEGSCVAAAEVDEECPIFCPSDWAPVCGSNGKTYSNKCRLEVASCRALQQDAPAIELVHDGVCKTPKVVERRSEEGCLKVCNRIYAPVCASDKTTHNNKCLFEVYQCEQASNGVEVALVHNGRCESKKRAAAGEGCLRVCNRIYAPVCASDGTTHNNKCLYEVYQCEQASNGKEVTLVHQGRCQRSVFTDKREEGCIKPCSKMLKPVCASNGQTFGNKCLFEVFQCMVAKDGDEVVLAHDGPCGKVDKKEEEECNRACPKIIKPVCASNGQTFDNKCLFEAFQCYVAKQGDEVALAHDGPC